MRSPNLLHTNARGSTDRDNLSAGAATRLEFIDGLRALAVILVLGCHYLYHTHASCLFRFGPWRVDLFMPFHNGAVGVDLFLVLSGFCLYYPLVVVKDGRTRPEPSLREFFLRRARRILPPYYASLLLFTLWQYGKSRLHLHVSDIAAPPTAGDLLAHLGMVHVLRPGWLFGMNPVFWSLGLEWFLYIGFPIFVVGFRRLGLWRPLGAVLLLSLAFQSLTAGFCPGDRDFFDKSLFARWPEFVLGMVAAKLIADGVVGRSGRGWAILLAVSLTLMALAVRAQDASILEPFRCLLWGLAFFSLLLSASVSQSILNRCCSQRPLVRLGVISYSVYLTHFPLMHLLAAVARPHLHSAVAYAVAWLLFFLPVSVTAGYLFHLVFERPFMGAPKPKKTPVVPTHALPAPSRGLSTNLRKQQEL